MKKVNIVGKASNYVKKGKKTKERVIVKRNEKKERETGKKKEKNKEIEKNGIKWEYRRGGRNRMRGEVKNWRDRRRMGGGVGGYE